MSDPKMPMIPQDLEKYLERYSIHMVKDVFRFLQDRKAEQGEVFATALAKTFLAQYVGAVVFEGLKSAAEASASQGSEAQADATMENFASVKLDLQAAVAMGFQNALSGFTGSPTEYYCTIKPVPEAKSKILN